jgi:hypothetical protein
MTTVPPEPTRDGDRNEDRVPGDRPPASVRRLERAPGERYVPQAGPEPPDRPRSPALGVALGGAVALLGALAMTLLVAFLAVDVGLLAVAALMGLLVAAGVTRGAGGSLPRSRRRRTSVTLAVGGVVLGLAGTWIYGLLSGSPLGPLDYLGQVFGALALVLPAAAAAMAWLGSR